MSFPVRWAQTLHNIFGLVTQSRVTLVSFITNKQTNKQNKNVLFNLTCLTPGARALEEPKMSSFEERAPNSSGNNRTWPKSPEGGSVKVSVCSSESSASWRRNLHPQCSRELRFSTTPGIISVVPVHTFRRSQVSDVYGLSETRGLVWGGSC